MSDDFRYIKTSFAAGELTPAMWGRVDIGKYQIGCETMENVYSEVYGSASNRAGTQLIDNTRNDNFAVFQEFKFSSEDAYVLVFTDDGFLRFIYNGGIVETSPGSGTPYEIAHPWTTEEALRKLNFAQSADVMWITSGGTTSIKELRRLGPTNWQLTDFTDTVPNGPNNVTGEGFPAGVIGKLETAITSGVAISEIKVNKMNSTPPGSGTIIINVGGTDYSFDFNSWEETSGVYTFDLKNAPVTPTVTAPVGTLTNVARKFYSYQVTAIVDFQETKPSTSNNVSGPLNLSSSNYVDLSWDSVTDATDYNIYREVAGSYYFIGTVKGTTFRDEGWIYDQGKTPPGDSVLDGALAFALALYDQRLCFGGSDDDPNTLWFSEAGIYRSFAQSPIVKSSDAFSRDLDSGQVNAIRHMIPIGGNLLVLTSGGTWLVTSSEAAGLSSDNAIASFQGNISVSQIVDPLVISNDVLVVQDKGSVISPLTYELERDGYVGNDLSVWAKHLFEGYEIIDWAYQKHPSSIIWMVRNDGIMIGLTYLKEQDVWAFHQHNTGRRFEGASEVWDKVISVETIPNITDLRDDLYLCVEREIDGVTRRYIEIMKPRDPRDPSTLTPSLGYHTWFADCAAQYTGTAKTTITGLDHLEGRTVKGIGWLNGEKPGDFEKIVSGGQIELDKAVENAIVGLGFRSRVKTLRLATGELFNTLQGEEKNIPEVTIRAQDTTEVSIGQTDDDVVPVTSLNIDNTDTGVDSGDFVATTPGGYNTDGQIIVELNKPFPMTIQALIMEVDQ